MRAAGVCTLASLASLALAARTGFYDNNKVLQTDPTVEQPKGRFDFGGAGGMPGFGGGGDDGGLGGAGFGGGGMPGFGGSGGMPGFGGPGGDSMPGGDSGSGGFPGGGNMPMPGFGGGSGGGGGFPSIPGMGNMGDMMQNVMNCNQKTEDLCCGDAAFGSGVCIPLYYCSVAIGEHEFGAKPGCGIVQVGDASKCPTSDDSLKAAAQQALSACEQRLKELYDLHSELGQCVADVQTSKTNLQQSQEQLSQLQQEVQDCQVAKMSGGTSGGDKKEQLASITSKGDFCPAESAALADVSAKYEFAVAECMKFQFTVKVPTVDVGSIEVPEINVGTVGADGHFDLDMPDLHSASFDGGIVVPGGGGSLNQAVSGSSGGAAVKTLTLEQRKANVQAAKKKCEEAKSKVQGAQSQLSDAQTNMQKEKAEACKQESSLVELQAPSPDAQVAIQIVQATKMFHQCAEVSAAVDAFVAVLERC